MRRLKKYLTIFKDVKIPWILLMIYLVLSMISSHMEVGAMTMTASIIDASQNAIRSDELIEYISVIAVSGILTIATGYLSGISLNTINRGVRVKLWNKIMRLPLSTNDLDNGAGLITRVTTDADASSQYVNMFFSLMTTAYGAVISLQQLFKFNIKMSNMFLLLVPWALLVGVFNCKFSYKAGAFYRKTVSELMAYLSERVRNFKLIKSTVSEKQEKDHGNDKVRRVYKAGLINIGVGQFEGVCEDLLSLANLIICFVYGATLVQSGELSIGRVIGFYSISGMMLIRITQFIMYFGELSKANGTMKRICEIMNTEDEKSEGDHFDYPDEDIVLKNVSFGYKPDKLILKDISCTIPKGKITAVIGPNGAGKTTMFKLLERIYTPDSGAIYYGERNIAEFALEGWRSAFSIVSQDNMVMSGTVRENICYGVTRNVTDEELIAVAKRAHCYDFIMETPGGFDAEMGMDGSNFSGGQRQCIAIARAMMRNPDYLLLDESTSNLDVKSEKIITEALSNLMKGKTTVMIAHNYSAAKMADYIIILKDGQIDAVGTPEQLKDHSYFQVFSKRGV